MGQVNVGLLGAYWTDPWTRSHPVSTHYNRETDERDFLGPCFLFYWTKQERTHDAREEWTEGCGPRRTIVDSGSKCSSRRRTGETETRSLCVSRGPWNLSG